MCCPPTIPTNLEERTARRSLPATFVGGVPSWMKWHIQLFPDRNRDCKQAITAIAHARHEVKKIIDVAHWGEPFTLGRLGPI